MSQNDFNIANQGFPATRADINSALQALASNSAGATEPSTTYAYQLWYDEGTDLLKMRNGDNDAWITLAEFDQTNDEWLIVSKTSLTGSAPLPSGTTAQRDGSPSAGFIRFNTETASFEGYDGSAWGSVGDVDLGDVDEDIIPDANSARDLGSSTKAWAEVHADKAILTNLSDGTTTVSAEYVVNGSAKAWVNFNGKGTVAVIESLNISSLTDEGTGNYSVGFTNAMSTTTYAVADQCYVTDDSAFCGSTMWHAKTASSVDVRTLSTGFGNIDSEECCGIIMGDPA